MWPLKPKVEVIKYRDVDWNKVKTIKDLVQVLKGTTLMNQITVREEYWERFGDNLLEDKITVKTFTNGELTNTRIEK